MNRTIKFRGKRSGNKGWAYGDLLNPCTTTRIVNYIEQDNGSVKRADYHYSDVDPNTVGQFTGLKDCNGKEVYEGDIVLLGDNGKIPYVVKWQEAAAMFVISTQGFVYCGYASICDTSDFRQVEIFGGCRIIGNIHDNPELIKTNETQQAP